MRRYTVHAARAGSVPATTAPRPPVLVEEGFAWGALAFGPFWFAAQRCWREAGLMLALTAAALFLPGAAAPVVLAALHVLAGFEARDARRRRLARRGLPEVGVVVASSADFAWFRLAEARPELVRALP